MTTFAYDPQMCRQCRGLCCQGHPGMWVDPRRFRKLFFGEKDINPEFLPEGVNLRDLEGVRIPAPRKVEHGCFFLGAEGCRLAPEIRPCQCLALEPVIDSLMEGEMLCRMPSAFSSQTARTNWQLFWKNQKEKEGTPSSTCHDPT